MKKFSQVILGNQDVNRLITISTIVTVKFYCRGIGSFGAQTSDEAVYVPGEVVWRSIKHEELLPREKDVALPHNHFNGGSGDTAACEEADTIEDQDEGNVRDINGKVEVGKHDKLLGAAQAAKSTRTQEEAFADVVVDQVKDDKLDGSQLG